MRRLIYISLFLLFSCSKDEKPKDLIPLDKMPQIVWDMMEADEIAQHKAARDTTLNLKIESYKTYEQVFAIHMITRESYFKSYKYYQGHPMLYKELIGKVKAIAEKERKSIKSK
jgi:hypothetical protein